VVRLQRVENCLSGYYAAFGSYPPVKVHGTRDIYCAVDENGDQDQDESGGSTLNWRQVNAACRCQPFGCEYPGDSADNQFIESWAEELKSRANDKQNFPAYASSPYLEIYKQGFTGPNPDAGFSDKWKISDWKVVKLFKFGVMSFLLPRYLFMMGGDNRFFGGTGNGNACAQWGDNNDIPSDPFEGQEFESWYKIKDLAQTDRQGSEVRRNDLARVASIPSQAVCARWMPNLEGICSTLRSMSFFGVNITDGYTSGLPLPDDWAPDPGTHKPPDANTPYKNATVTIHDGWWNEFYYYSPAPYQSYTVWSAGPNGKTFPPWMTIESLNGSERKTAMDWKSDDIIQMSH